MISKVKVAGHWYKVKWRDSDWLHLSESLGNCDTTKLEINIVMNDRWPETLWHEVGHAIYYEYGIKHVAEEEPVNGLYMSGVHQVLKDNPEMRRIVK